MLETRRPDRSKTDLQFWAGHVRNHRKSRHSQAMYCRENKLKLSTFQYWVRKLKPGDDADQSIKPKGNQSSHNLVEVTRILSPHDRRQVSAMPFLEIEIGQTWKIRVPPSWAVDDLKKILAALKELVC